MVGGQQKGRVCKSIRVVDGERIAVGVDAHKKDYKVCVWSVDREQVVERWTQPPDPGVLIAKLREAKGQLKVIAYEAGPMGFGLARALQEQSFSVMVVSPAHIPVRKDAPKSDRRDAFQLARLSAKGELDPILIPTVEHEQERAVQRMRNQTLDDRKRVQMRIKALLLCQGIAQPRGLEQWSKAGVRALKELSLSADLRFTLDMLVTQLEQRNAVLVGCDKRLVQLRCRPHNQRDIGLLTTIPGIGERTALEFILEMGPVGRFDNRLVVSKYQGLSPDVQSTSDKRVEGPLNLSGNRRLKTLLVEAAWRWVRYDLYARWLYGHMLHNTGRSQSAITAVARKLGIIMWIMREHATAYKRPLIPGESIS